MILGSYYWDCKVDVDLGVTVGRERQVCLNKGRALVKEQAWIFSLGEGLICISKKMIKLELG